CRAQAGDDRLRQAAADGDLADVAAAGVAERDEVGVGATTTRHARDAARAYDTQARIRGRDGETVVRDPDRATGEMGGLLPGQDEDADDAPRARTPAQVRRLTHVHCGWATIIAATVTNPPSTRGTM